VADQEARYRAITNHLAGITQNWKVGFEYQPEGILVGSDWYPILKMDWVTGPSLSAWIDKNVGNSQSIHELSGSFASLISDLAREGIAHGDLQHGNLLVAPDGTLRLVDYDGMFVPALSGMAAAERGHRNYQSPSRGDEFDSRIDRFSAWTIYLSLVALAQQPTLWYQLREPSGEHLLLAEEDFKNPAGSARFPALLNSPALEVRTVAQKVLELVSMPIELLPELEPVNLAATLSPPSEQVQVTARPDGPQTILPAWMAPHLGAATTVDPVRFDGRSASLTVFARVLPLLSVLLIVLGLVVGTPVNVGVAFLLLSMMISIFGLGLSYRHRKEVLARRPVAKNLDELANIVKDAQRESRATEALIESFEKKESKRQSSEQIEKEGIYKRQREAAADVDKAMQKSLAKLASDKAKLARSRQFELERALASIQAAHVERTLSGITLSTVRLEGFGPKLWSNMRNAGISTAADFTGVRVMANGQSKIALIVLKSGREVRVPGVAQVKATRLADWRRRQTSLAERTAPTVLPEFERVRIFNRYAQLERDIATAELKSQKEAQAKKAELGKALSVDLSQFSDRQRKANGSAAQERAELTQRKAAAQARVVSVRPSLEKAQFQAAAYVDITFVRFLKFSITNRSI
jgi:hypothetical protein